MRISGLVLLLSMVMAGTAQGESPKILLDCTVTTEFNKKKHTRDIKVVEGGQPGELFSGTGKHPYGCYVSKCHTTGDFLLSCRRKFSKAPSWLTVFSALFMRVRFRGATCLI